jgi:hypothetical protein
VLDSDDGFGPRWGEKYRAPRRGESAKNLYTKSEKTDSQLRSDLGLFLKGLIVQSTTNGATAKGKNICNTVGRQAPLRTAGPL